MFIDKNLKRINIYAPYEVNGVRYNDLTNPEVRASLGVTEVIDPQPPQEYIDNPEFFYYHEIDEFPYGIFTPKSDEQIAEIKKNRAKSTRATDVNNLTVITSSGNEFDADEVSQGRLARAIIAMEDTDTIPWVLTNNSVVYVGRAELKEALRMGGLKQAELWIKPYQ